MKVLILAGGLGTRLAEETRDKPKPMVEIGGYPILWHIMKIYSFYGLNDFVILTGYKSHIIKEYFLHYYMRYSNVSIDLAQNSVQIHKNTTEPWKITMLYTGQDSMTGERIAQAREYVGDEDFCLTYGDGLSDVNIKELINFHNSHGGALSMTSIMPEGRFGIASIDANNRVFSFDEKPRGDFGGGWINGGFFVCNKKIFDYLHHKNCIFEQEPLKNMANDGELYAYKHTGFWKCMDTLKDKNELTNMWYSNQAPWAIWQK